MRKDFYQATMSQYADLPLREMVLFTLRQAILTGELLPGERLMELPLSDDLGVSRTPVREAIRNLELEGLVTMIPRRGAYVAQLSEKNVRDVLEVRRALEGLSVSRATQRISKEMLEELRQKQMDFENICKSGDAIAIARADVSFHDVILKATGNTKLISIMSNLSDQIFRFRYEYIKNSDDYQRIINDHRRIFDAVSKGNEDEAVREIQGHIDIQAENIIAALKE